MSVTRELFSGLSVQDTSLACGLTSSQKGCCNLVADYAVIFENLKQCLQILGYSEVIHTPALSFT